ncbi:MAG TPA: exosome complex protein Rrp42 [archaeon]|nr:exosome complex protein Rrp42 [archaeon]
MISELWDLRVDKVVSDLKEGKRIDGRKVDELRKITIKNGISENADGSARVTLGQTDVMAGVKMVPGTPYPDSPGEGSISVGAELLPMADPEFEVGPPRDEAIELSRVVDRGIRESKAIDFSDLCIVEGEKVWVGYVDIYIINNDGNLFDACGVAAMSALLETKLPKLEDYKIVKGEYSGKLKLKSKPILNTFAKIGNVVVADPILSEEKAMSARFSVTVTEDDNISAFQKGLAGSFKVDEINSCIDIALKNSKQIRKLL